jgi:hypothetical protein
MKKFLQIFYITIGALILIAVVIMAGLQINKSSTNNQLKHAQSQIESYNKYLFGNGEFNKLKKSDKDDVYYYAANGKRYIFPTIETYQTWFGAIKVSDIMTYDLLKLYETPLGGNVTCRPGTLIQTPTDPNIYMVVKNGHIRAFSDKTILDTVYNFKWQKTVLTIPNFYFTNYTVDNPISNLSEFPEIPSSITIDQDKGFAK